MSWLAPWFFVVRGVAMTGRCGRHVLDESWETGIPETPISLNKRNIP